MSDYSEDLFPYLLPWMNQIYLDESLYYENENFFLPEYPEVSINIENSNSSSEESNKKIHSNNWEDNLLRKIQINFFDFIVNFANDSLKCLKFPQRFLFLSYDFKKNVNKQFVSKLKESNLKEIIVNNISGKYKKYVSEYNSIMYKDIIKKENETVNKIFSINILTLFKFYYKSNKIIDLNQLGIKKIIHLSTETKMFKDLLIRNQSKGELHIKNIKRCAIKNFLPDYIFLLQD